MDAKQITIELAEAQKLYSGKISEYHTLSLVPVQNDEAMSATLDYYTVMVVDFIKLMQDFQKYYHHRPVVAKHLTTSLLKISDQLNSVLDPTNVDLSYLDGDYDINGET